MSLSSRLQGALEAELRRNLCFSFTIGRNLSRHAGARLQPMDRFELIVQLRNDAEVGLLTLRGVVSPTALASFTPASFSAEGVAIGEAREVARFEAMLTDLPHPLETVLQQIALVSFSARADLSRLSFADLDRPLLYSPDPSEARRMRGAAAAMPRSIPLSRW